MLHTMKSFRGGSEPLKGKQTIPLSVIMGGAAAARQDAHDDLGALEKIGMKRRFAKSETIFSEGDEAAFSYKVVSGAIRLCKYRADGRRQVTDFVLPGDRCGFLDIDEHRFTAEAASDVVVMVYPQRQVEALGNELPGMRKQLNSFLANRLADVQDHLVMLGCQTAKERVVSFLLTLADRTGTWDGDAVDLPMSRQDVADYLGLTIETVCRVLSDLKRARLVTKPSRNQIVIVDIRRLRALVNGSE
jgi:CRP/FNR family nitrogen fixation transcriptional regulator